MGKKVTNRRISNSKAMDGIRDDSKRKLLHGKFTPFSVNNPLENDFIIALIVDLNGKMGIIKEIARLQSELLTFDPTLYIYPPEYLHITLTACTQRHYDRSVFTPKIIQQVKESCHSVLDDKKGSFNFDFNGVNVCDSSVFIQAYPAKDFFITKQEIVASLKAGGIQPLEHSISYPHITIAKIASFDNERTSALVNGIEKLRDRSFGKQSCDTLRLILTDRLMSKGNTTLLENFQLI